MSRGTDNKWTASRIAVHKASIPLRTWVSPGAIIGRGGSTIKLLSEQSGARIWICNATGKVQISRSATAVAKAVQLVSETITAAQAIGHGRPRWGLAQPQQAHYLLNDCFGDSDDDRVVFKERVDGVAAAAQRPSQRLTVIQPAASTTASAADYAGAPARPTKEDMLGTGAGLEGGFSRLSVDGAAIPDATTWPTFLKPSQNAALLQIAVSAVKEAISAQPPYDAIKLKFSLGKNFFFRGASTPEGWTLQQLQTKTVPKDLGSVFSNAVTPSAVGRLECWLQELQQQQGFVQLESKSSVSVHLVHPGTRTSHGLSFINYEGTLSMRKFKSGNTKLAFGTVLCGADSPDWRYKLLGKKEDSLDGATKDILTDLAASASLNTNEGSSSRGCIDMFDLCEAGMENDKERHKEKTIYLGGWGTTASSSSSSSLLSSSSGSVKSTDIKIVVAREFDSLTSQHTVEVSVSSPALHELLGQLQSVGNMDSSAEQQVRMHLANLMNFARAAVRSTVTA